jgi:hypothetical protein
MMDRRSVAFLLAAVALAGNVVLTLVALVLGMHFEGTSNALADSAKGQWIAVATVPGLIASILALVANRRNAKRPLLGQLATGVAVVCALAALVIYLVVPGGGTY